MTEHFKADAISNADRLDQRSLLAGLYDVLGYGYEDVASVIQDHSGQRPDPVKLWRVRKMQLAGTVPGLARAAIDALYATSSNVAKAAMLQELKLRNVDRRHKHLKEVLSAVAAAEKKLEDLKDQHEWSWSPRMARLSPIEKYEIALDRAALCSLKQQILLYRFRYDSADAAPVKSLVSRSLHLTDEVHDMTEVLLSASELGPELLIARVVANHFFVSYIQDQLSDDDKNELPTSKEFVATYGKHRTFLAAFRGAARSLDPRIAFYFAEMASLLPRPSSKISLVGGLGFQHPSIHPVETACRLLVLSRYLDHGAAQKSTPMPSMLNWKPIWLQAKLPQIEEAMQLVEGIEKMQGIQRPHLAEDLAGLIDGKIADACNETTTGNDV